MTQLEELLAYLHEVRGSDLHLKPGTVPHVRVDGQLRPAPFEVPGARRGRGPGRRACSTRPAGRPGHDRRGQLRAQHHRPRSLPRVDPPPARVARHGRAPGAAGDPRPRRAGPAPAGRALRRGGEGAGARHRAARARARRRPWPPCIDRINHRRACHILTIEDPIEVLHADAEAIVTQREVGSDTAGYAAALRSGLRQDADVIFVGELVDAETARAALTAAEVGHLVISTMRASSVADTDHPPHRPLPGRRAGPGPPVAGGHAARRRLPAPARAGRRQGPHAGGRDPHRDRQGDRLHRRPDPAPRARAGAHRRPVPRDADAAAGPRRPRQGRADQPPGRPGRLDPPRGPAHRAHPGRGQRAY